MDESFWKASVPVTAKLSKAFYDRLGEQVASELVDWFNQVDATYRSDLREMNELNFARFDAKLGQRIAELTAQLRAEFRTEIARLDARFAALEAMFERRLGEQSRWLVGIWITVLVAAVALWFRR